MGLMHFISYCHIIYGNFDTDSESKYNLVFFICVSRDVYPCIYSVYKLYKYRQYRKNTLYVFIGMKNECNNRCNGMTTIYIKWRIHWASSLYKWIDILKRQFSNKAYPNRCYDNILWSILHKVNIYIRHHH